VPRRDHRTLEDDRDRHTKGERDRYLWASSVAMEA